MSGWKRPGRSGAVLYAVLAAVVGALTSAVCSVQIERKRPTTQLGHRGLPPGGLIVVANHTSLADGVLLALAGQRLGRPLRMLGTAGIIDAPILKHLFRRLGFIPVRRRTAEAAHSLAAAADAIAAGEAIALYPEGRITRDPKFWPERSKTGAVRLALQTGAPIVAVASVGAHRVVGRRRKLWRLLVNLVRRPTVQMRVGEPIDVRTLIGLAPGEQASNEQVKQAADAVMSQLVAMVEGLRGERAPDPLGVPRTDQPGNS